MAVSFCVIGASQEPGLIWGETKSARADERVSRFCVTGSAESNNMRSVRRGRTGCGKGWACRGGNWDGARLIELEWAGAVEIPRFAMELRERKGKSETRNDGGACLDPSRGGHLDGQRLQDLQTRVQDYES